MNTNNNQPITAALPELAVIGNLVYESYDASRLVDAIVGCFTPRQDSLSEPVSHGFQVFYTHPLFYK